MPELTSEYLEEAKQLLRRDLPDDSAHEGLLLFVSRDGEVFPLDSAEFQPGMAGHISVAPKVFVIALESQASEEDLEDIRTSLARAKAELAESKKLPKASRPDKDELDEMEENIEQLTEDLEEMSGHSVVLNFSLDLSEIEAEKEAGLIPVGAFVFAPTKDGTGNVDKPVVLHSFEELEAFMVRWALRLS